MWLRKVKSCRCWMRCMLVVKLLRSVLSFLRISSTSMRVNDGSFTLTKGNRALVYPKLHPPSLFIIIFLNSPVFQPSLSFFNHLPELYLFPLGTIILLPSWVLKYFACTGCAMENYQLTHELLFFTLYKMGFTTLQIILLCNRLTLSICISFIIKLSTGSSTLITH